MSLVLLEGAQYGRCILAGDIPANRRTMGDSILYFPKDGVTELAAEINRCLSQEVLRRTMGRKARKFVKQRYSWVTVVDQLERVYRRSASTVTRTS
jgi:glycosyltransferase involved in cell wall biosynthesis